MGAWSPEAPTYDSPSANQNLKHEGAQMGT